MSRNTSLTRLKKKLKDSSRWIVILGPDTENPFLMCFVRQDGKLRVAQSRFLADDALRAACRVIVGYQKKFARLEADLAHARKKL